MGSLGGLWFGKLFRCCQALAAAAASGGAAVLCSHEEAAHEGPVHLVAVQLLEALGEPQDRLLLLLVGGGRSGESGRSGEGDGSALPAQAGLQNERCSRARPNRPPHAAVLTPSPRRTTLLCAISTMRVMRYVPAGISTATPLAPLFWNPSPMLRQRRSPLPPQATVEKGLASSEALAMARMKASVSSVMPSPLAPKSVTSTCAWGRDAEGCRTVETCLPFLPTEADLRVACPAEHTHPSHPRSHLDRVARDGSLVGHVARVRKVDEAAGRRPALAVDAPQLGVLRARRRLRLGVARQAAPARGAGGEERSVGRGW